MLWVASLWKRIDRSRLVGLQSQVKLHQAREKWKRYYFEVLAIYAECAANFMWLKFRRYSNEFTVKADAISQ